MVILLIVVALGAIAIFGYTTRTTHLNTVSTESENDFEKINPEVTLDFLKSGLQTNTAIASIPLDEVLGGGPGKDGIPAILSPKFTSVADADETITPDIRGLVVEVEGDVRFYPYNILVWHEMVNDVINDKSLLITFCPLCGSAIVFDRTVDNEVLTFGVSGKLYESNLLMYDKKTETLWSQIIGEAVVGTMTGKTLDVYASQVMTFADAQRKYENLKVLSTDTGERRNYSLYPYGDYDTNERIFFPISVEDNRLPAKQIMYIVSFNDASVAFHLENLQTQGTAIVDVNGTNLTAQYNDGEATIAHPDSGDIIPGYFAMWFSWAQHHQHDGVVWK